MISCFGPSSSLSITSSKSKDNFVDLTLPLSSFSSSSLQRYLASKELKAQKWRYHAQHQTWFQKHENKSAPAGEQEVGTYSYFDHETAPGWAIKKKEFRFDFKSFEGGEGV